MNFINIDQCLLGSARKDRTYNWLLDGKPSHARYLQQHDSAQTIRTLLQQDRHPVAVGARTCFHSEVFQHKISGQ